MLSIVTTLLLLSIFLPEREIKKQSRLKKERGLKKMAFTYSAQSKKTKKEVIQPKKTKAVLVSKKTSSLKNKLKTKTLVQKKSKKVSLSQKINQLETLLKQLKEHLKE
ncbi:MAG: hypothetical protein Q8777_02485 [Candidatus Phytoplasma stylosanthis]|uniref:hypothetical protein n=1 Tax=Candidatus Phytoplasma stylosanthis TaxID=2798314 RepID=UPI002939D5DF|nr:hypothetical protein [Candidatus Phytoplasma stylosanthis]MDV3168195.1 hypothetical protein [Candidatus Phytoplasma stylosanthis]